MDELSTSDIREHVLIFGIDAYPPIEVSKTRTHLNIFYEEARSQKGELFDELVTGESVFRISKTFGQQIINTFMLTPRGPVFTMPLQILPDGESLRDTESALDSFQSLRSLFFSTVAPDRKIMRMGMVRKLFFGTGSEPSVGLITAHESFANAGITGAESLTTFRDAKCNIRVTLEAGQMHKTVKTAIGPPQTEHAQYGLQVQLDVNSSEIRPQSDADIAEVIARAAGLWPDMLLEFVNERRAS